MLCSPTHAHERIGPGHVLAGRKVYIPPMAYSSARAFVSTLRLLGIEADLTPPSDARTRELAGKYLTGDECYPAKVTVGDFLKVIEAPDFDPQHTAFFMPTAEGPCRFGQYAPFMKKLLRDLGYPNTVIISPTSANSYSDLGNVARTFVRIAWRALVCGDVLQKFLLKTRPYELEPGATDRAYAAAVDDLCQTIEQGCTEPRCHLRRLVAALTRVRDRFRRVPAHYDPERPLIGVVGEIFCRLHTFSNDDMVRQLESYGAECWLSDISEWVWYTNAEQVRRLKLEGRIISFAMLANKLRARFQRADEHALLAPFREDFRGYEEPHDIRELLDLGEPYLPVWGVMGEMVLSTGKAAYLARKGADGVVDISPFTCMNGIVSEAIYPKLSRDYAGIPIRNFYFDGTQSDLDRDIGIYLELAHAYRQKKPFPRRYPPCFTV